jgi:hypothetical protein
MKKKNTTERSIHAVKVYLAILQLGRPTASEIADKSGLDRTYVHLALCDLLAERLVETRFTEKMRKTIMANLDRMIAGKDPLGFKESKWHAV